MGNGTVGIGGNGFFQQTAGSQRVEVAEFCQTLSIEPCRFRISRKEGLCLCLFSGRNPGNAEPFAHRSTRSNHKIGECLLTPAFGERRNCFSQACVLYAQVEPDRSPWVADIEKRAQHHEVATEVSVHPPQRFSGERIRFWKRETDSCLRDTFSGDCPQFSSLG